MQLVPRNGVLEDLPLAINLCEVVVGVYEVGLGSTGILDLLESIPEGNTCDSAIVVLRVVAVYPLKDTCYACWHGAFETDRVLSAVFYTLRM